MLSNPRLVPRTGFEPVTPSVSRKYANRCATGAKHLGLIQGVLT